MTSPPTGPGSSDADLRLPDFSMTGRVALITGAGRGIGLAIARGLAAAGCAAAIQDLDLAAATAEAERINSAGGRAIALGGDIADRSLPARLVAETADRLGSLDALVNNASIQVDRHWLDQDADAMSAQLDADLLAPILLCQCAAPLLRARRRGRILNIGSIQAINGNPRMLAYSAAKTALQAVTRALARDLAGAGVTVNLLSPGYFDTQRNQSSLPDDAAKADAGRKYVPLGRLGDPADAAGIALCLCSDAGAYITGQTIYVDGGMSVR